MLDREKTQREEAVEYFTNKYEFKRRAVLTEINNLRAKLNPIEENGNATVITSPSKKERQLKELSRLEKCDSYIHSVETRVRIALSLKRIF